MTHVAPSASRQSKVVAQSGRRSMWFSGWFWAGAWLGTRGVMFAIWYFKEPYITGDVGYYLWNLTNNLPSDEILREYPLPVVWFLELLRFISPGGHGAYLATFAVTMAVFDAAFTALLWQTRRIAGVATWIVFAMAQGSIIWWRYDMVSAFVVGVAVLWVTRRPAWSGSLVAFGAALKLWPALLIAPLVGRGEPPRRRMIAFGVTGAVLAGLSFLAGGWQRLISPLTWQSDRGLQIESVPATLAMFRAMTDPNYQIGMSKFNAFEVHGPGTDLALKVSSVLMALALANAAALAVCAWLRRNLPADWMGLAMISIVATMLVANKTFSPQYFVWFGAPVAAWMTLLRRQRDERAWTLVTITIVIAILTQLIYPLNYEQVIGAQRFGIGLLVVRNVLLTIVAVLTVAWTWVELLRPPRYLKAPAPSTASTEAQDPAEQD